MQPEDMNLAVCCADIGSIARGNFGWAVAAPNSSELRLGTEIADFADEISDLINRGMPVALGFECPLFVPLPSDPNRLTSARRGEGSRAWSAGAGAGALATGLTEVTWVLARVRATASEVPDVHFSWEEFTTSSTGLFIWEAFVSGGAKSSSHTGDAELAVKALLSALPDPTQSNLISESDVFSLVAAALLRAGWHVPLSLLHEPCLVLAA